MSDYMINANSNKTDSHLAGGKAANLWRLSKAGYEVPAWCAVPSKLMREQIAGCEQADAIQALVNQLQSSEQNQDEALCRQLRELIANMNLQGEIAQALTAWLETQAGDLFAVRSSADDEDGAADSFAGMHDSYLCIAKQDVATHICKVWASAYTERAIAYRKERDLALMNIQIGVVVQAMVQPAASGVIFTVNPVNQHIMQLMVSAVYGLGEGLVSGELAADTYVVSKQGEVLEKQIEQKAVRLIYGDAAEPVKREAVPEAKQNEAALADDVIDQLRVLGCKLEQMYGKPQDIEFAVDDAGKVYLLQSRPITTLKSFGPAAGYHQLWDNSNIIESYSGVTRPLTFSFIRHAYQNVYESFCEIMRVPKVEIENSRTVFANMLGYMNGHVYYNLQNWYRLIRLFPGYEINKRFMESMMGVSDELNPDEDEKPISLSEKIFVAWPRLIFLLVTMVWRFMHIQSSVKSFDRYFYRLYDHWHKMDFSTMQPAALMKIYREMENKLLRNWKTPIINDFFVMIFYGVLKKLCVKWCDDESGTLQNDLISGDGDIESTAPTQLLLKIARQLRGDERAKALVLELPASEVHPRVMNDPLFDAIRSDIEVYLERYGDRCMNELKLESPSLREDPTFIYTMLQNYLRMDELPAMEDDEKGAAIRKEAEAKAQAAINKKSLSFIKLPLFNWVLNAARRGVRNRENMRLARTRIYGVVRQIMKAIGQHWQDEALLEHRDDIFYLTVDEVWDFVQGTAVSQDLKGLAALRKAEQNRFEASPAPDDRFSTWGMVYYMNTFEALEDESTEVSDDPFMLKGIGCSPGEVQGEVKVILSPQADMQLNGEILVAGRTDPGWVGLYPSISGLLIERGSILSHSAIVAREMGIPTVVGIKQLSERVKTGDEVAMDGGTGEVRLVTAEAAAEDTDQPAS